jgi:hypothetical protein
MAYFNFKNHKVNYVMSKNEQHYGIIGIAYIRA